MRKIGYALLTLFLLASLVRATTYINNCTGGGLYLTNGGETYLVTNDLTGQWQFGCIIIANNSITLDCQGHSINIGFESINHAPAIQIANTVTYGVNVKNCVITDLPHWYPLIWVEGNVIDHSSFSNITATNGGNFWARTITDTNISSTNLNVFADDGRNDVMGNGAIGILGAKSSKFVNISGGLTVSGACLGTITHCANFANIGDCGSLGGCSIVNGSCVGTTSAPCTTQWNLGDYVYHFDGCKKQPNSDCHLVGYNTISNISSGTVYDSNNIIMNSHLLIGDFSPNFTILGSGNTLYNNFIDINEHYPWQIQMCPYAGKNISNNWNSLSSGNYWNSFWNNAYWQAGFSQTCADSNYDGICDSSYDLTCNNYYGNSSANIDYLPLTNNPTSVPLDPPDPPNIITDCINVTSFGNYDIINDIQMTGEYAVDSACINIRSDNVNLNCNSHSISIEPGYGADIKISSHTNVSVSNCVLANATVGLYLDNSDSNVFSNIHVSNILGSCWYFLDRGSGIYLESSDLNNFDHIVVESVSTTCPMSGIDVINSNNNTFTNVLLENNTPNGGLGGQVFADFYLLNSNYSNLDTIQALTSYDEYGNPYTPSIALESSNFNYLNHISQENTTVDFTSQYTISDSNVLNNSDVGAVYVGGNDNIITNNIITEGIEFYDNGAGSHNYIYNNLFNSTSNVGFNNLYGTYFYDEVWNMTQQNGTPIYRGQNQTGGNYWSNPTGTGYSDTCFDFNGDGFCDVPFTMTYGNCYGTPTPCEEITNQYVCENQQICAWDSGNRTCYFNGGLYDCNTFYDELGCLGQSGCSWNISTSTDYLPLSFATTIGTVNVSITSPADNTNISYGAQPITIAFHVSGTLASYNATLNVNGTNISSMIIISNNSSSFVLPIYSTGNLNVTIIAYNSSISDSDSAILNVVRTDTLMLLNSSAGWSFVKGTYTTLNCVASNPEVVPKLYLDGSLVVIPYGFAPYYATPILVTCNSSDSENYSGNSTSHLLNISAGGGTGGGPPPTYPPNPPSNGTNPPPVTFPGSENPPPTIPGFGNGITSATPLPPIVIQTDKLLIIITPGGYNVTMAKWANFQDHLYVKNLGVDRVNIKFATDSRYVAYVGVNPVYLDIDPGSNVSFDIKAGGFTTEGYYQIPVDVQVNGKTEATAHMYVTITGEEPPLTIIFGNGLEQLLEFLRSKILIPIIGLEITPFFILTIGTLYYAGTNASRKRNWNIFLMLLVVTVVITVVYPAYIIPGGV